MSWIVSVVVVKDCMLLWFLPYVNSYLRFSPWENFEIFLKDNFSTIPNITKSSTGLEFTGFLFSGSFQNIFNFSQGEKQYLKDDFRYSNNAACSPGNSASTFSRGESHLFTNTSILFILGLVTDKAICTASSSIHRLTYGLS